VQVWARGLFGDWYLLMGMKIRVVTAMKLECLDGQTGVVAQDSHSDAKIFQISLLTNRLVGRLFISVTPLNLFQEESARMIDAAEEVHHVDRG
jgi:hypothetical protein